MNDRLVIIPTYNEKENIDDLFFRLASLPLVFDILLIDDNYALQFLFIVLSPQ